MENCVQLTRRGPQPLSGNIRYERWIEVAVSIIAVQHLREMCEEEESLRHDEVRLVLHRDRMEDIIAVGTCYCCWHEGEGQEDHGQHGQDGRVIPHHVDHVDESDGEWHPRCQG